MSSRVAISFSLNASGSSVPAIANVFGRVVGSAEEAKAFYDISRRLHSEGFKQIEIRRVEA